MKFLKSHACIIAMQNQVGRLKFSHTFIFHKKKSGRKRKERVRERGRERDRVTDSDREWEKRNEK